MNTKPTQPGSAEMDQLRLRVRRVERRARLSTARAVSALALTALFNTNPQVIAPSPGVNLTQLVARKDAWAWIDANHDAAGLSPLRLPPSG